MTRTRTHLSKWPVFLALEEPPSALKVELLFRTLTHQTTYFLNTVFTLVLANLCPLEAIPLATAKDKKWTSPNEASLALIYIGDKLGALQGSFTSSLLGLHALAALGFRLQDSQDVSNTGQTLVPEPVDFMIGLLATHLQPVAYTSTGAQNIADQVQTPGEGQTGLLPR
ncbi:hypothetical protein LEMLEM_LOCUS11120 [Lemmus lemmus]